MNTFLWIYAMILVFMFGVLFGYKFYKRKGTPKLSDHKLTLFAIQTLLADLTSDRSITKVDLISRTQYFLNSWGPLRRMDDFQRKSIATILEVIRCQLSIESAKYTILALIDLQNYTESQIAALTAIEKARKKPTPWV